MCLHYVLLLCLYWHRIVCCHKAVFSCSIGCNMTNKFCCIYYIFSRCVETSARNSVLFSFFPLNCAVILCRSLLSSVCSILYSFFFLIDQHRGMLSQIAYCKMCSSVFSSKLVIHMCASWFPINLTETSFKSPAFAHCRKSQNKSAIK